MAIPLLSTELEEVVRSIKFNSTTELTIRDQLFELEGINIGDTKHSEGIIHILQDLLYQIIHCKQKYTADHYSLFCSSQNEIRDFVAELSNSNRGKGMWEQGWEVHSLHGADHMMLQKDGLILWASSQEFSPEFGIVEIGLRGSLRMPKEFCGLVPGFYVAIGNASPDKKVESGISVRLYWNISSCFAAQLTRSITVELNNANLPFQFKILKDPLTYGRTDSAVLYIDKKYLTKAKDSLSKIYQQVHMFINTSTSPFVKTLAPGIGLAEDPGVNESFGLDRCRILAESLVIAYNNRRASQEQKLSDVAAHFQSKGLDPTRPYLNAGSIDDYETILKGGLRVW